MTHGPPASRKRQQQQIDSDIEQSVTEVDPNGLPTPPDGGWGWMVVLASFSIHIISKYRCPSNLCY